MTTQHPAENVDSKEVSTADQSLRSRALDKYHGAFEQTTEVQAELTAEDVRKTIHELRVHQIELEMQNDELRQSQMALEESRSRFRDLYDHAPVGYCLIDSDGRVHDANCTLAELLGHSQNHLNSLRFSSLINKDDQDTFYHLRRRILVSEQPQRCELRMLKGNEECTWMEMTVSMAARVGDSVCLRVALMNIDARVRAEAAKTQLENQLRESQKMEAIGTLAGGIAHDFNNILTVILVNSEIADRLTRTAAPTVLPFVSEIGKAAGRARELVNQILAFCRRQPTDRQTVALAEVIEDTISMLRSTIPARFQLQFTSEACVPNVLADCTQIEQVIINLATNAMQAMDGQAGKLRIHLDAIKLQPETIADMNLNSEYWADIDMAVRIVFADDGPGMEASVLERIFEPFFTTKPVNEGTGLGLAVVHGIVRAHDGEIFVESKLGRGTTFTIYLPPARPVTIPISNAEATDFAKVSQAHGSHADTPAKTETRILYVDDDSWVLNSIVRLLREYGVAVHGYSEPAAALNLLSGASMQFDMLVTDYNMPGISGLEFARQVHKICPTLPVVVTSGYIDEELRANAQQAGVVALMPKPFTAKAFLDLANRVRQSSPG